MLSECLQSPHCALVLFSASQVPAQPRPPCQGLNQLIVFVGAVGKLGRLLSGPRSSAQALESFRNSAKVYGARSPNTGLIF